MRSINRPVAIGVLVVLAVIAVAAAALAPAAFAGAEYDRATGGGQIMTPSGGGGPGDTLAFNAQNTGTNDAARGQLQYVQHSSGGPSHGIVQCLVVSGNGTMADIAGTWASGALAGNFFELKVTDNGQGSGSNDDFICFNTHANDPQCNNEAGAGTTLGRGNVQIYNAP